MIGKQHSVLPSLIDAHSSLKLESQHGNTFLMSKVLMQKASDEVAKISENQMNDESLYASPRILSSSITKFSLGDEDTRSNSAVENGEIKEIQGSNDQSEPSLIKINDEKQEKEKLLRLKNELENELEEKMLELKSKKSNVNRLSSEINTFNAKKSAMVQKLERSEEEFIKHQKVVQLLPNAEENLNKLMSIVQRSKTKLEDVKQQWQEHKDKLDLEYKQTQNKTQELEKFSEKTRSKGLSVVEKMQKVQEDMKDKEALHKHLLKLLQSLKTDGQPREFYTNRILDLVKQIEKLR